MPVKIKNQLASQCQPGQRQQYIDDYERIKTLKLSLDLTRGKPSTAQLALSDGMLALSPERCIDSNGVDARNYGGLDGLPAMKKLFAEILDVQPENVIVGGNSSLTMMYEVLSRACQFGVVDGNGPWNNITERKFLCPTPGYDRHFLITEHLGFKLIPVDMNDFGPDMDKVESLVAADDTIKGIWCVPKYSNPTGVCYSRETVQRLARMKCAAPDFRIMWDNAYAVHHFSGHRPVLENISKHADTAGHPNRVVHFASTSKISYAGSGVAAMAGSAANVANAKTHIGVQSIGPDKVNQLRHLNLFSNLSALNAHMEKHAQLLKPKFDRVNDIFERELGAMNIARWSKPQGGYFVNVDVPDGYAKKIIRLAAEAGIKLTAPGAPFPYGIDPHDSNIRIAPTFPSLDELEQALNALVVCIKLAVTE